MKPKNNKEIVDSSDSRFKAIKESKNNNGLYIDKTKVIVEEILEDLNKRAAVNFKAFLGPRRFGKSLTLDVIEHIFNGDKGLFEGTYLGDNKQKYNDKWWNDMSYPVIKIDFNLAGDSFGLDTESAAIIYTYENIYGQLLKVANKFKLEKYILKIEEELEYLVEYKKKNEEKIKNSKIKLNPDYKNIRFVFDNIIEEVNNKYNNKGVVILVDEYDKVVTNFIDKPDLFNTIKNKLTDFYTVTKSNKNIKFLFLTGISRMGSNSLLSGMNHISDLTYAKEMEPLLGISEEELNKYFDLTEEEHELLKKWYNGYRFVKENKYIIDETGNKIKKENSVYCLFSTLKAIKNNDISNYWISTATPTMLTNYLKGMVNNGTLEEKFLKELYDNENYKGKWVSTNFLSDSINIKSYNEGSLFRLLLQTGYLTIKDYDEQSKEVLINYSNLEVKDAFKDLVRSDIYNIDETKKNELVDLFKENNFLEIKEWFKNLVNGINHDLLPKEKLTEGQIHSIFHAALETSKITNYQSVISEKGNSDLVVMDEKHNVNYLFEFKVKDNLNLKEKNKKNIMQYILGQCVSKNYIDAVFRLDEKNKNNKSLIIVPVVISKTTHRIDDFEFYYMKNKDSKELENLIEEEGKEDLSIFKVNEVKDFFDLNYKNNNPIVARNKKI
jgi:hypothetical protein